MSMNQFGCQGRDHTPSLNIKTCPECGSEVEVFSTDTSINCEKCGFTVYNDAVSCVEWCQYGRLCVGDAEFERLMEIAKNKQEEVSHTDTAQKNDTQTGVA